MSDMGESPPSPGPVGDSDNASPPKFPWWVRKLAVAYVLSRVVGGFGFVLLFGVAASRWITRREVDGWVLGLGLGGLACPAFCAAFRWWFERFGRRRWPDAESQNVLETGKDK